jgi:hypothetical protein
MRKLLTVALLAAFGMVLFNGCRAEGEIGKTSSGISVPR